MQIYNPICDRSRWSIRTNEELNTLYQNIDMVTEVKQCHLISIENNAMPKIVLDAELDGKKER
jgi:hypothetical protein